MPTDEEVEAAAKEIVTYIAEIVRPWTEFYGHEEAISNILRKHLEAAERVRSLNAEERGSDHAK